MHSEIYNEICVCFCPPKKNLGDFDLPSTSALGPKLQFPAAAGSVTPPSSVAGTALSLKCTTALAHHFPPDVSLSPSPLLPQWEFKGPKTNLAEWASASFPISLCLLLLPLAVPTLTHSPVSLAVPALPNRSMDVPKAACLLQIKVSHAHGCRPEHGCVTAQDPGGK